jgi:hypothetical protein
MPEAVRGQHPKVQSERVVRAGHCLEKGRLLRLSPAQNYIPIDTVDSGFGIDLAAATEVSCA